MQGTKTSQLTILALATVHASQVEPMFEEGSEPDVSCGEEGSGWKKERGERANTN